MQVVEEQPIKFYLPNKYKGFWVNENYISTLKKTNSPRKAQELGTDDFFRIYKESLIQQLNIHDGGMEGAIKMNSLIDGEIWSRDFSKKYYNIQFTEDHLFVNKKKYIQISKEKVDYGLDELANNILMVGEYFNGDEIVEFKTDGTVEGLGRTAFYEVVLDYMDVGRNEDKMYLRFEDEQQGDLFLFEKKENTLNIFHEKCLHWEEENEACMEVTKGDLEYQLIGLEKSK